MRTALTLLAILAATSAGVYAQWTMQISNTTADLRGIHSVGNGVAWASGTNGTVLRTEDGGYVWQSCSVPPGAEKLDFRGVQAFDANTAIVMSSGPGDSSRLYKTTDGCHSWKLIFKNPDKDGFWDAIQFANSNVGYLLGDPVKGTFALFATENGGRVWTRQQNKGLRTIPGAQSVFAASNSSLLDVNGFLLFGSGGKDGGQIYAMTESEICIHCSEDESDREGRHNKWKATPTEVGNHSDSSGIFSVGRRGLSAGDSLGNSDLLAVGGDYKSPDDGTRTATWSTDSGKTWHLAETPPHGYRSAVAYEPSFKTWITVGPNGTDVSTDDGKNWRALRPDPARHEAADADRNWNALSLPFVVGPHGRIGRLDESALKR